MLDEATVQPESSEEVGLLDSATIEEQKSDPQTVQIDHREGDPNGDDLVERPDYWPENFWNKDQNAPDLEGIAKSWMDLRKTISQGKHKAPVDGKYDASAFGDIPESDPVRQHVQQWAKDYGVSQAAFDALVGKVVEMGGTFNEDQARSVQEERRALGQNADAIIKGMVDWATGLVSKGVWSREDFDEFKVMGGTARGIRALMKLRESYEGMRIPVQSVPVDGAPSKEELYQMVGDKRYQTDAAYRQKVEKMFQQAFNA